MNVVQDLATRWTTAFNNGEPGKLADLYTPDAVLMSGVLGALKGKAAIEAAIAKLTAQSAKITFRPEGASEKENVVWGYWDYTLSTGPAGHGAIVAVKEAGGWKIAQHISNVRPKVQ